jgi:outer membrane murein-binding lipoprotein Lpp
MKRTGLWILIGLVVAGLVVAGCGSKPTSDEKEAAITIEELDSGLAKLTLSAKAAERLGVETAEVRDQGSQKVIPYAAVIYDAQGATWAYATADSLTFERAPIVIETITGEDAILSDGPDAGTVVLTTGAAELYGAETGVGGGH